jgi:hypothetical protein
MYPKGGIHKVRNLLIILLLLSLIAAPVFAELSSKDLAALQLDGSMRALRKLGISLGIGGYYNSLGIGIHCNLTKQLNVRAAAGTSAAGAQLRYMLYDENLSPFVGLGYIGTETNGVNKSMNILSFGIEMINANGTAMGLEVSPIYIGGSYSSDKASYSIDGYVGYYF